MSLCTRINNFCRTQAYNAYSGVISRADRLGERARNVIAAVQTIPVIWKRVRQEYTNPFTPAGAPPFALAVSRAEDRVIGMATALAMNFMTPADYPFSTSLVSAALAGYLQARLQGNARAPGSPTPFGFAGTAFIGASFLASILPAYSILLAARPDENADENERLLFGVSAMWTLIKIGLSAGFLSIIVFADVDTVTHHSTHVQYRPSVIQASLTSAAAAAGFSVLGPWGAIAAASQTGGLTKAVRVVMRNPFYRDAIDIRFQIFKIKLLRKANLQTTKQELTTLPQIREIPEMLILLCESIKP